MGFLGPQVPYTPPPYDLSGISEFPLIFEFRQILRILAISELALCNGSLLLGIPSTEDRIWDVAMSRNTDYRWIKAQEYRLSRILRFSLMRTG